MKIIAGFFLLIGVLVGGVVGTLVANVPAFTLRPLTEEVGPINCFEDHGKAALVAEIDESGSLVTEWEASCLVPVK